MSAALLINLEKGVCVDILNPYSRAWVQMTYQKGFALALDPTSYNLVQVPEWLQQAAILKAKILLQSNPSLEDPLVKMDVKEMKVTLHEMLQPRLRYAPSASRPVISSMSGLTVQSTATGAATAPDGYTGDEPADGY